MSSGSSIARPLPSGGPSLDKQLVPVSSAGEGSRLDVDPSGPTHAPHSRGAGGSTGLQSTAESQGGLVLNATAERIFNVMYKMDQIYYGPPISDLKTFLDHLDILFDFARVPEDDDTTRVGAAFACLSQRMQRELLIRGVMHGWRAFRISLGYLDEVERLGGRRAISGQHGVRVTPHPLDNLPMLRPDATRQEFDAFHALVDAIEAPSQAKAVIYKTRLPGFLREAVTEIEAETPPPRRFETIDPDKTFKFFKSKTKLADLVPGIPLTLPTPSYEERRKIVVAVWESRERDRAGELEGHRRSVLTQPAPLPAAQLPHDAASSTIAPNTPQIPNTAPSTSTNNYTVIHHVQQTTILHAPRTKGKGKGRAKGRTSAPQKLVRIAEEQNEEYSADPHAAASDRGAEVGDVRDAVAAGGGVDRGGAETSEAM